jgi:hypothetical protein
MVDREVKPCKHVVHIAANIFTTETAVNIVVKNVFVKSFRIFRKRTAWFRFSILSILRMST